VHSRRRLIIIIQPFGKYSRNVDFYYVFFLSFLCILLHCYQRGIGSYKIVFHSNAYYFISQFLLFLWFFLCFFQKKINMFLCPYGFYDRVGYIFCRKFYGNFLAESAFSRISRKYGLYFSFGMKSSKEIKNLSEIDIRNRLRQNIRHSCSFPFQINVGQNRTGSFYSEFFYGLSYLNRI